jgi:hypothetical protein
MQAVSGATKECFRSPLRIWEVTRLAEEKGIEPDGISENGNCNTSKIRMITKRLLSWEVARELRYAILENRAPAGNGFSRRQQGL